MLKTYVTWKAKFIEESIEKDSSVKMGLKALGIYTVEGIIIGCTLLGMITLPLLVSNKIKIH